jgi:hypothetical protein
MRSTIDSDESTFGSSLSFPASPCAASADASTNGSLASEAGVDPAWTPRFEKKSRISAETSGRARNARSGFKGNASRVLFAVAATSGS